MEKAAWNPPIEYGQPPIEEDRSQMPTYEYACRDCGRHLEVVQSFTDKPLTKCPSCKGVLKKVFSPVGIVLKGSGFYKTDNRSASSKASSATDSTSKEPTSKESTSKESTKEPAPSASKKDAPSSGGSKKDSPGSSSSSSSEKSA